MDQLRQTLKKKVLTYAIGAETTSLSTPLHEQLPLLHI